MTKVHLVLISVLFACAISHSGISQSVMAVGEVEDSASIQTNLLIEAQVLKQGKPFQGVTVEVRNGNKIVKSDLTNAEGFFSVKLNFDSVYVLAFVKEGYITKKVEIDTRNMPAEDKEYGYDLGMFKLQMLKEDDANNFRLYLKPIARFHYSEIAQIYVVDKQFKKDVKKRFEEAKEKPDVIKF